MLAALEGAPVESLPWPGNPAEPLVAGVETQPLGSDGETPGSAEDETSDPLTALIEAIVGGQPAERK
jgi:hypothetical protein